MNNQILSQDVPVNIDCKRVLPVSSEDELKFENFNFKLLIIEELMYHQHLLQPEFNLCDFCKDYDKYSIDPNEYINKIIPEVRKWFEDLSIPKKFATNITSLYLDAACNIYSELMGQWDGENGEFDIKAISTTELAQFPNLTTIHWNTIGLDKKALKVLQNQNINIIENH